MEPEGTTTQTITIGDAHAALAAVDSSSATPQTNESTSVESPAAATAQPDTTSAPAVTDSTKAEGERARLPNGQFAPPPSEWPRILDNQRKKSAEETEARVRQEIDQQYGWAKDIPEAERQGLLTWRLAMNGDPQALAHLKANPQVVTWLKGLVEPARAATPDPEPEPDLQTADGTPVYSATRQREWREWNNRQLTGTFEQKLQKELAPVQSVVQTFQQEQAKAAFNTTAASAIANLEQADPAFKEHRKDVADTIMKDADLFKMALGDGQTPPNPALAMEIAWGRVYRTKVVPQQQKHSEAQVLSTLQQRAVAATTNPATATSGTPVSTLGDARASLAHASAQLGG